MFSINIVSNLHCTAHTHGANVQAALFSPCQFSNAKLLKTMPCVAITREPSQPHRHKRGTSHTHTHTASLNNLYTRTNAEQKNNPLDCAKACTINMHHSHTVAGSSHSALCCTALRSYLSWSYRTCRGAVCVCVFFFCWCHTTTQQHCAVLRRLAT